MNSKKELVFDIETNAVTDWVHLTGLDTIHCIVAMDRETEEIKTFDDFSTNNSGSIAQGTNWS